MGYMLHSFPREGNFQSTYITLHILNVKEKYGEKYSEDIHIRIAVRNM
jgi:hypothetical protein